MRLATTDEKDGLVPAVRTAKAFTFVKSLVLPNVSSMLLFGSS
jgi:hypothetical protein